MPIDKSELQEKYDILKIAQILENKIKSNFSKKNALKKHAFKKNALKKQLDTIKACLNTIYNIINEFSLGEMYEVYIHGYYIDPKTNKYVEGDSYIVIEPTKLNKNSMNCKVYAAEHDDYKIRGIKEERLDKYQLSYSRIVSIKPWDKKRAPFLVNWAYLSKEFKELAFSTPTLT